MSKKIKITAYVGLFLLSLSLLMTEIVYARTARVAFGYEYQLFIISLAISGIGFGGIPVYLLGKRLDKWFTSLLTPLAILYAVSVPAPFIFVKSLGIGYAISNINAPKTYFGVSFTTMGWFCASVFVVYLLGGAVVALFLSADRDRIPVTYFYNMAGSAAGAFTVVPLLDYAGTEIAVAVIYAISLGAAFLFALRLKPRIPYLAGLVVFALISGAFLVNNLPYLKAGGVNSTALITASNSFSQIEVNEIAPLDAAKGLSPTFQGTVAPGVKAYSLLYERKLKTNAVVFSRLSDMDFLAQDLFSFPYLITDHPDALLIGVGGGADVVRARLAECRKVTALEMNPLMIDIAINRLKTTAFEDESVDLVVSEGRNYVNRSGRKYDLIYLPNTGGFGGRSVNALYLPDNYLHTREAHVGYLNHLNETGILAISNKDVVIEDLMGVAISALKAKGKDAAGRVALIKAQGFSLCLIKPSGFTQAEKTAVVRNAKRLKFEASFPVSAPTATGRDRPITDDKPFLWAGNAFRNIIAPAPTEEAADPSAALYGALDLGGARGGADEDGPIVQNSDGDAFLALRFLFFLAVFGFAATALMMAPAPFLPSVRAKQASWQVLGLLAFSAFLGMGYMIFQLVMIQRTVLFVAHPTYSLALVLFCFLFFGGLGGLATGNIDAGRYKVFVAGAASGLVLLLIILSYLMNHVFFDFLYLNPLTRTIILAGLLAPPCFLAGGLFPIGLRSIGAVSSGMIPWMWSVNGLAIVLGGALGALGSYVFGFRAVLAGAAVFYLTAMVLFLSVRLPRGVEPRNDM